MFSYSHQRRAASAFTRYMNVSPDAAAQDKKEEAEKSAARGPCNLISSVPASVRYRRAHEVIDRDREFVEVMARTHLLGGRRRWSDEAPREHPEMCGTLLDVSLL